jgi:hypothetical protein
MIPAITYHLLSSILTWLEDSKTNALNIYLLCIYFGRVMVILRQEVIFVVDSKQTNMTC